MGNTIILLGWGLFLLLFVVSFFVVYLATDFIKGQSLKTKIIRILFWFLPFIAPLLVMTLLKGVSCIIPDGALDSYKETNATVHIREESISEYTEHSLRVKKDSSEVVYVYTQNKDATIQMSEDFRTNNVFIELTVKTEDGVTKVLDHHGELLKEYR